MGTSLAPVRRRVLAGAFIVGITVALLAPVAAYATNTASFSARTPRFRGGVDDDTTVDLGHRL